jgi:hypothetical protein
MMSLSIFNPLIAETFMVEIGVNYGNAICSSPLPTLEHKIHHNDGKQ